MKRKMDRIYEKWLQTFDPRQRRTSIPERGEASGVSPMLAPKYWLQADARPRTGRGKPN